MSFRTHSSSHTQGARIIVASTLAKIINDCSSDGLFCWWKLFFFAFCVFGNLVILIGVLLWLLLNVMLPTLLRALLRIFIPRFLACPLSLVLQLLGLIMMTKSCLAFKPSILQHHLLLVFLTPLVILVRPYLFHVSWLLASYVVSKPVLLLNWII